MIRRRSPSSSLPARLTALHEALDAGDGRLPAAVAASAQAVLDRAGQRMRLSEDHTVVALAGATGSGKSSLFNAFVGSEVARVGVLRPTTSQTLAAIWGAEGSEALLDWLDVRTRHQVDASADATADGLILLDLPDHDSTTRAHRDEVDRMVEVVDLMVWVVDPQKYADAVLHERYLRPMAAHAPVTVVVLNQVDRLGPAELRACLADLRRVLADDGLDDVAVLPASATTGSGIGDLRALVQDTVRKREAATARLTADVLTVARALQTSVAGDVPPGVQPRDRERLVEAVAEAAGVTAIEDAVRRSFVLRGTRATGWPVTRWTARLLPDPIRRYRLDRRDVDPALVRTSLPAAGPVARSRVASAIRSLAQGAATGAPLGWQDRVDELAGDAGVKLADRVDQVVGSTDLGVSQRPRWWAAVGALQWLLLLAAFVGGLWLFALAVVSYFQLPSPETPRQSGIPLPTLLLVGGLLLGLVLGILARVAVRAGARRRGRRAGNRLRAALAPVADAQVVEPIEAELTGLARCRAAVERAAA